MQPPKLRYRLRVHELPLSIFESKDTSTFESVVNSVVDVIEAGAFPAIEVGFEKDDLDAAKAAGFDVQAFAVEHSKELAAAIRTKWEARNPGKDFAKLGMELVHGQGEFDGFADNRAEQIVNALLRHLGERGATAINLPRGAMLMPGNDSVN